MSLPLRICRSFSWSGSLPRYLTPHHHADKLGFQGLFFSFRLSFLIRWKITVWIEQRAGHSLCHAMSSHCLVRKHTTLAWLLPCTAWIQEARKARGCVALGFKATYFLAQLCRRLLSNAWWVSQWWNNITVTSIEHFEIFIRHNCNLYSLRHYHVTNHFSLVWDTEPNSFSLT